MHERQTIRSAMGTKPGRTCALCGLADTAMGELRVVEMYWRQAGVSTCEMCGACWRSLWVRRVVGGLMYRGGAFLAVAGGFAAFLLVAGMLAGRERDRAWYIYWATVATVAMVVSIVAVVFGGNVRVPAALREGRKARHLVRFSRLPTGASADEPLARSAAPAEPTSTASFGDAVVRCIEGGASVYALADLCGTLPQAVRTFAEYEAAKHAPQNAGERCLGCSATVEHSATDLRLTEWTWQSPADGNRTSTPGIALLMAFTGHVHLSGGKPVVCRTYHTFCWRCVRRARGARLLASALTLPLGLLLVVTFLIAAAGMTLGLMEKQRDGRLIGWLICAGGCAATAGVAWLFHVVNKRRVPPALREIARPPFALKSVTTVGPLFEAA
jgi:hypothetical protein